MLAGVSFLGASTSKSITNFSSVSASNFSSAFDSIGAGKKKWGEQKKIETNGNKMRGGVEPP
jgi:hypothetical protein